MERRKFLVRGALAAGGAAAVTKAIANSDGKNQVPVRNELPRQTVDEAVAMAAKIGRRREPVESCRISGPR